MAHRPSVAARRGATRTAAAVWVALLAVNAVAADLGRPVSGVWTAVPVGAVVRSLATQAQEAILLDRRVDPTTPVTIDADDEPLGDVVARIAELIGARAVPSGGAVRIVPGDRAIAIAAAERRRERDLATLAPPLRRVARSTAPWIWPDGSSPRDVLRQVAAASAVSIDRLDDVPHDHLRAGALPPLPLEERLDLLLAQFDLRVDWSAAAADASGTVALPLVPLADGVDPAGADRPRRPPLAVAHARQPKAPRRPTADDRFTLRAEAKLGELIDVVGKRTGLRPVLDQERLAAIGVSASTIVRVEVRDATRGELLDAITAPLGLSWRIDGDRLEVPAPR